MKYWQLSVMSDNVGMTWIVEEVAGAACGVDWQNYNSV